MHLAMWPLLRFVMLLLRCVPAFFRNRNDQAIVELALRQQLATFALKGPRPRITSVDRTFWVFLSRIWSGWDGARLWSSSSPTRSSAGIARDFGCIGEPSRSGVLGDLPSRSKCRLSFVDSRVRMVGGLERSKPNSRSWGRCSPCVRSGGLIARTSARGNVEVDGRKRRVESHRSRSCASSPHTAICVKSRARTLAY